MILAENSSDVGITGGGVVDGQGLEFVVKFNQRKNVMVSWNQTGACLGDECRPRLVGFLDSTNVKVWNITFTLPAYWWLVCFLYFSVSNLFACLFRFIFFYLMSFFFFLLNLLLISKRISNTIRLSLSLVVKSLFLVF